MRRQVIVTKSRRVVLGPTRNMVASWVAKHHATWDTRLQWSRKEDWTWERVSRPYCTICGVEIGTLGDGAGFACNCRAVLTPDRHTGDDE